LFHQGTPGEHEYGLSLGSRLDEDPKVSIKDDLVFDPYFTATA